MIELTPEQWQAIAGEENPMVIEPESKTPYVVIRKEVLDQYQAIADHDSVPPAPLDAIAPKIGLGLSEAEKALALRVIWMRRMGLDENEITDSLRCDAPTSVAQEMMDCSPLND